MKSNKKVAGPMKLFGLPKMVLAFHMIQPTKLQYMAMPKAWIRDIVNKENLATKFSIY